MNPSSPFSPCSFCRQVFSLREFKINENTYSDVCHTCDGLIKELRGAVSSKDKNRLSPQEFELTKEEIFNRRPKKGVTI